MSLKEILKLCDRQMYVHIFNNDYYDGLIEYNTVDRILNNNFSYLNKKVIKIEIYEDELWVNVKGV